MHELTESIPRPLEHNTAGVGETRPLGWYSAKGRKAHFLTLHSAGHAVAACGVGGGRMTGSAVPDQTAPRCKACLRRME